MPYSQNDEEQVLLDIFKTKIDAGEMGSVLDIGAFDGKFASNSLRLIELGWSATLIEPSPTAFIALRELHGGNPKIRLINAAVGLDAHLVKFWDSPDAAGTTDEANREKWSKTVSFREHWVSQITPAMLQNQFCEQFDLISLDTEGTSAALFFTLRDAGYRPTAWVVEHDGQSVYIASRASEWGYRPRMLDQINIILAR